MWEGGLVDGQWRRWRNNEWWQRPSLQENMYDLIKSQQERRIMIQEGKDRLRLGYSPSVEFNIKEATNLHVGYVNLTKEPKWKKIWSANHWPKIATFLWLIKRRRILT